MERRGDVPIGALQQMRKSARLVVKSTLAPIMQMNRVLSFIPIGLDDFEKVSAAPGRGAVDALVRRKTLIVTTDEDKKQPLWQTRFERTWF